MQLGNFDQDKLNIVIILLANNLQVNLFEVIYRHWQRIYRTVSKNTCA